MRINRLKLVHFRNYGELELVFSAGKNVFLGRNGQGKTNLLEAVYLLSHARSHRTSTDRELIQTGESGAAIQLDISPHAYAGHTRLEAIIRLEGQPERLKTAFKLNGAPLRSRSDVLGHLPTVSFFLPDLLLLRGAPEDRRRWLDAAVVQYDKRHLTLLTEFQRIRLQKNRLLKEEPERISRAHLDAWNEQFAKSGAAVIASRERYLGMIEDLAAATYQELSLAGERLTQAYQPHGLVHDRRDRSEDALAAELLEALNAHRSEEIRRGTCLVGPHRDDIRFYLNGLDAAAYGSQGQQRTIVLALKLTELSCLSARLQEPPVLLLDDVMAELDPERQRQLVERIDPQSQVLITTTHPADTWQALLGDTLAVYHVEQGHVNPTHPVEAYGKIP